MDPIDAFMAAHEQTYWMATAAIGAIVIGLLTVAVNGFGLYFLWGQLKANREALVASSKSATAAAEAARIGRLTGRPWVKFEIDGGLLSFMPEKPDEVHAMVSLNYENIGKTPAIQTGVIFKPLVVVQGVEPDIAAEFTALLSKRPYGAETLFPGDQRRFGLNEEFPLPPVAADQPMRFRLIAAIVYREHTTGELLYTPLAMTIMRDVDGRGIQEFYTGMGRVTCRIRWMGEVALAPN